MCVLCGTICAYKRQIREHMSKVHNITDPEEQDTKYFARNLAPEQPNETRPTLLEANTASFSNQVAPNDDRNAYIEGNYFHSESGQEVTNQEKMEKITDTENQLSDGYSDFEDVEGGSDSEDIRSSEEESFEDSEDKYMTSFEGGKLSHIDEEVTEKPFPNLNDDLIKVNPDYVDIKKETHEDFIDVTQVMKVKISEVPSNTSQEPKDEPIQQSPIKSEGSSRTCQFCQKVFRDNYKLKVHVLTHTGEKPHSCNLCQQSFALAHQLSRHMLTHKEKTLYCTHCPKMFSDQKLLDLHLKGLNDIFLCSFCTKTFKRKGHLKVHLRLHTGETPYSCSSCDAKFHRSSKLKEHCIQYHDAPRQTFMCEACGKEYARRGDMLDHMRTHTGEEPFNCDLCNISFSCRRKYIGHKNTHEKNKMCRECGKCFESNANLRRHEKSHSGIKDFQCDLCLKAYSSMKSLQQHMEIVHKISHEKSKTFSCPTCDKAFTRNEYLQRHLLKH